MMTVAGAQAFFCAVYGFACLGFASGAYAELKEKGYAPLRNLSFYAAAAAAVLPVIGPAAALLILYADQGDKKGEPFTAWGMLASIARPKVNSLVLFFFLVSFSSSLPLRHPA